MRLGRIFLGLVLLGFSSWATASSDPLDRPLLEAGSVQALLDSPKLLDEYFLLLQNYYGAEDHSGGEKFPRKGFNAIVSLLKRTIEAHPELKDEIERRLMDTSDLGTEFSFDVIEGGNGVTLDSKSWSSAIDDWKTELRNGAQGVSNIEDLILQMENRAGKMQASDSPAEFFVAMRKDPDALRVANALLLDHLNQEGVAAALDARNPDEALFLVHSLRKNPQAVVEARIRSVNLKSVLLPLIKRVIPPAEKLERKTGVASPVSIVSNQGSQILLGSVPTGSYVFRPLSRRFHGIWKGISFKECIGGSCEKNKRPHLERILTVILKGTQILHLEINGNYHGFIQMVPIQKQGRKYASVDFSAFPLRNWVTVKNRETGKAQTVMLFDLWLQDAIRTKPKEWEGFVVGSGRVVNNANVIEAVHHSIAFVLGKNLGPADSFETGDPWQELIPDLQSRHGDARDIGGRMVFDAAMRGQGDLTLLQPTTAASVQELLTESRVQEFFETVNNPARKGGLVHLLGLLKPAEAWVQNRIVTEFLNDRKAKVDTWGDVLVRDELQQVLVTLPIRDEAIVRRLVQGLKRNLDSDLAFRIQEVLISGFSDSVTAREELTRILRHPDSIVRRRAREVLEKMDCGGFLRPVLAPRGAS